MRRARLFDFALLSCLCVFVVRQWLLESGRMNQTGGAASAIPQSAEPEDGRFEKAIDENSERVNGDRDPAKQSEASAEGSGATGERSRFQSGSKQGGSNVAVVRRSQRLFEGKEPALDMELVWIDPGEFLMGSPEEEPGRRENEGPLTHVTITRGFWISGSEITIAQYASVVGREDSWLYPYFERADEKDVLNRAVSRVSWANATNFCWLLTEAERRRGTLPDGFVYRLPTEAEWEC